MSHTILSSSVLNNRKFVLWQTTTNYKLIKPRRVVKLVINKKRLNTITFSSLKNGSEYEITMGGVVFDTGVIAGDYVLDKANYPNNPQKRVFRRLITTIKIKAKVEDGTIIWDNVAREFVFNEFTVTVVNSRKGTTESTTYIANKNDRIIHNDQINIRTLFHANLQSIELDGVIIPATSGLVDFGINAIKTIIRQNLPGVKGIKINRLVDRVGLDSIDGINLPLIDIDSDIILRFTAPVPNMVQLAYMEVGRVKT